MPDAVSPSSDQPYRLAHRRGACEKVIFIIGILKLLRVNFGLFTAPGMSGGARSSSNSRRLTKYIYETSIILSYYHMLNTGEEKEERKKRVKRILNSE